MDALWLITRPIDPVYYKVIVTARACDTALQVASIESISESPPEVDPVDPFREPPTNSGYLRM